MPQQFQVAGQHIGQRLHPDQEGFYFFGIHPLQHRSQKAIIVQEIHLFCRLTAGVVLLCRKEGNHAQHKAHLSLGIDLRKCLPCCSAGDIDMMPALHSFFETAGVSRRAIAHQIAAQQRASGVIHTHVAFHPSLKMTEDGFGIDNRSLRDFAFRPAARIQHIAIARMMLKNAPIVILDEATAFTDPENEDKIQQSIAALTRGKTLLVIAHRLSTIKNADNIVVLKEGAIVAEGTQEQLLESCPLYRDMWQAHIGAKNWAVSSAAKEA